MLYTLNLFSAEFQLYLNKAKKIKYDAVKLRKEIYREIYKIMKKGRVAKQDSKTGTHKGKN